MICKKNMQISFKYKGLLQGMRGNREERTWVQLVARNFIFNATVDETIEATFLKMIN